MVTEQPTKVLIVSNPGMMCDSLCSLLATLPDIRIVGVIPLSDLLINRINRYQPEVILVDCIGEIKNMGIIREIKNKVPYQNCIIIAENVNKARLAYINGADDVLLRGCTGYEFRMSIQKVINHNRQFAPGMDN